MNHRRPYDVVRRTDEDLVWFELVGPLNQPADLSDVPNPDAFCDFVNDVFEKGYEAGYAHAIQAAANMAPDELYERATRRER